MSDDKEQGLFYLGLFGLVALVIILSIQPWWRPLMDGLTRAVEPAVLALGWVSLGALLVWWLVRLRSRH
jgi:hypothetical protein